MSKHCLLVCACMIIYGIVHAQQDTLTEKTLEGITLSANKWEQKLNEVPNKITKITRAQIIMHNPQTAADLLGQAGGVFIQKSQLGGGSPMIRGFATNRVLLVMDGVRMNNAIYRSGNLQNVISIDALSTETAEVIFGPGSLIYGSDAIGGVMDFHSLEARFSSEKKFVAKSNALARYSSANQENTLHADINLRWKKWSALSSATYSDYADLKMGIRGGQDRYLRREYVQRIGSIDSIVQNENPRIQRFSGYNQFNFLQKIRYRPSAKWDAQYSFVYAGTSDAPRYDRLIQYRNGALRFAEWNYGPMIWRMHNVQMLHSHKNALYDQSKFTFAFQDYEESRIDRLRNNNIRTTQVEEVSGISMNWDAIKNLKKNEFYFGTEYVYNKVRSYGTQTNISNSTMTPSASRYPDGSEWMTMGIYSSYKWNIRDDLTLTTGLRYSFNKLDAAFDKTFVPFPFDKVELNDGALTGNAGITYRPAEGWQFNGNISTGYRMPNVDDIGKLFENAPGIVTVPNPDLTPEYAWNFEAGVIKNVPNTFRIELNFFHTRLHDAIVRRAFTFNGEDSIDFNGFRNQVEALQNVAFATVTGAQAAFEYFIVRNLSVRSDATWTTGKETDDVKNEQVPLRHAPPFYGTSGVRYKNASLLAEFYVHYNSKITNADLAPSEQAKTEIYATDAAGKPYSPGWHTMNLKASYQFTKKLMVSGGWENITNQRYRPYSSGIVAPGSNLIFSVRISL